jgi:hypothetical protein
MKECKPNAHHTDYTIPLRVRFFCRQCHNKADKAKEKRLGILRVNSAAQRRNFRHYRRFYNRAMRLWGQGVPQTQIGRRLGVSNATVSNWVNLVCAPG